MQNVLPEVAPIPGEPRQAHRTTERPARQGVADHLRWGSTHVGRLLSPHGSLEPHDGPGKVGQTGQGRRLAGSLGEHRGGSRKRREQRWLAL